MLKSLLGLRHLIPDEKGCTSFVAHVTEKCKGVGQGQGQRQVGQGQGKRFSEYNASGASGSGSLQGQGQGQGEADRSIYDSSSNVNPFAEEEAMYVYTLVK